MRAAWLLVLAACGSDGAHVADSPIPSLEPHGDASVDSTPDANVDAAPNMPDLMLEADEMTGTVVVTDDTFTAGDCEIAEGCVGAPGTRRLLRFDAVTSNRGATDFVLGPVPPNGESNDTFIWSVCHMHHHVRDYAEYDLLDSNGAILVTGRKQAFCLEDVEQVNPASPGTGYTCMIQGISHGWADVYSRYLPCQWIDVTDVPSGQYTLRVTVNPTQRYPEANYDNDTFTMPVSL
ncbi:MAG TPA: lysyl oxidase family protein [Kofleriaceae bacterium]|jgi:hypothetical protein